LQHVSQQVSQPMIPRDGRYEHMKLQVGHEPTGSGVIGLEDIWLSNKLLECRELFLSGTLYRPLNRRHFKNLADVI
jgi:hypothetical protein